MKKVLPILLSIFLITALILCYQSYVLIASMNEEKENPVFSFDDPKNEHNRTFIVKSLLIQHFNHALQRKFVAPINDYKINQINLVYDDPNFSVFETVYRVLPRGDPEKSNWYQPNYETRYQMEDGWIIRHHRIRINKKGTRYYLEL